MTKASDNAFPKVILVEGSAPSTPSSGQVKVYAKTDGQVYSKDDAGAETPLGAGSAFAPVMANEVQNFPSMEGANDTQPEWWEESAGTATLTEVDVVGESITETWERCLKLVTTADVFAYQRLTYADEPRIKSGKTVSCRVAVWAVGGATARVRLQSSVGSLGVQTTTAAAWTILTVEAVVLDGTYVELRLEVNNGTAYFVPLAFGIGSSAPSELPPRGLLFRHRDATQLVNLAGTSTVGFTDVDCTSATSPLACIVMLNIYLLENNGGFGTIQVRRNGSSEGSGVNNRVAFVDDTNSEAAANRFPMILDDGQVFEYEATISTGTIADGSIACVGWYEWA